MHIAIAHAEWMPGRAATLARLLGQLGPSATVFASHVREPAVVWARRVWEWVAQQDESVAVLNDDVLVCEGFARACAQVASVAPGELVSLHVQAPAAVEAAAGGARWARCYWLSGPAYLMPPAVARALLDYWAGLPWRASAHMNEDNLAIQWAWKRQRAILATLPALATHDIFTPSSLGYDAHPYRVPSVPAVPNPPPWPAPPEDAPYVDNPWAPATYLEAMRTGLSSEGGLCAACMSRSAVVAFGRVPTCLQCSTELALTMMRRAMR